MSDLLVVVPMADGRWLALTKAALLDAIDAARDLGLGSGTVSPMPSGTDGMEPLMTSEQLGALLGVHETTIEALAKTRSIPSVRVGRMLRFEPAAVKAALRERST
jgi:excisionase family DNA binding protein